MKQLFQIYDPIRLAWEEDTLREMCEIGCSRGDAQSVMEANDKTTDRLFAEGKDPKTSARALLPQPAPTRINPITFVKLHGMGCFVAKMPDGKFYVGPLDAKSHPVFGEQMNEIHDLWYEWQDALTPEDCEVFEHFTGINPKTLTPASYL